MSIAPRVAVVVGAGAFGAAAALELRARGWSVSLVDRGHPPHADASSTDISKMVRMDYGSDVFYHELAEAALDGWERWAVDWPGRPYHGEGFLVLAPGPMRPGGFEYESHRVLVERGYHPERMDRRTLERRFPAWRGDRYPDGYFSPRGGWAESGAVVEHLVRSCRAAGVRVLDGELVALDERGSRVGGARVARDGTEESLPADAVVVCSGAWTPRLLPWTSPTLVPVAQPIVHFGVDDPGRWSGPAFPPFAADIAGSGWYGFPALPDGRLKLGHHGRGVVTDPDARGSVSAAHLVRARAFLQQSLPGLAHAPVVGTRVCMYCDSRDGDLLIDRDPERDGLVVAAGGSGHAFKFTPVLGAMIADAVEGRPNRWLERFRWRTITSPSTEEARYQEE